MKKYYMSHLKATIEPYEAFYVETENTENLFFSQIVTLEVNLLEQV